MIRALVACPWVGSGVVGTDPYRPAIAGITGVLGVADATGQPVSSLVPVPDVYVVEIEAANQAALDACDAEGYSVLDQWEESDAPAV